MKKLISIAAVLIIAVGVFAQGNTELKTAPKYCCTNTKCDHCSSQPGTCSHHKTAYVKEGMYYCPMCDGITSDKPGKCSKCGMDMVKMEMETETKYCCSKCDWSIPPVKGQCPHSTEAVTKDGTLYCVMTHDKAGKCPKCGMEMGKIEVKEKKEHKH